MVNLKNLQFTYKALFSCLTARSRYYLFGSFAKDKQRKDSDIDLYVKFDPDVPIGLEYVKIYLDLKELTGREVDLVTEKSISKYIKAQVEKEKILIYERKAA